jgi:hypothetical protein
VQPETEAPVAASSPTQSHADAPITATVAPSPPVQGLPPTAQAPSSEASASVQGPPTAQAPSSEASASVQGPSTLQAPSPERIVPVWIPDGQGPLAPDPFVQGAAAAPPGPYPPAQSSPDLPPLPDPAVPMSPRDRRRGRALWSSVALMVVVAVVLVVAILNTSESGSGGPSTGAASTSPSPSPVSTDEYQRALTAFDGALGPAFQQVRAARTPVSVSNANAALRVALTTQAEILRAITPPVAAQATHAALLTGLDSFTSNLREVDVAAESRNLCAGSSATAMVSRMSGAAEVRSAVAALAAAGQGQPYKVGTFLPKVTADSNRRMATGWFATRTVRGGSGEFKIDNGGQNDAVISLVQGKSKKPGITVYVRSHGSYTVDGIKDGSYEIYTTAGVDWDKTSKVFTRDCGFAQFDSPAKFVTTSTSYTKISITLNPVKSGNATVTDVSPDDFPTS